MFTSRNRGLAILSLACIGALLTGCATYTTPGRGVSLTAISSSDASIDEALKRRPEAPFPARLAVARAQSGGYRSYATQAQTGGTVGVVTARDFETDEHFARLQKMPQVTAVAALNRLVLPPQVNNMRDIRLASAELRADIVLLYTVDTQFRVDTTDIGPLSLISLGFAPNKKLDVRSTAAAGFFDVRSGFVYGIAEAGADRSWIANPWSTQSTIDSLRVKTEREAFEKLLPEVEKLWSGVIAEHGGQRGTAAGAGAAMTEQKSGS